MIAISRRGSVRAALLLAAAALSSPHALAAQRTFVHSSPFGNDANTASNCSLTAPCRSFNAAISVTDPGGEVVILDTAGYGPMTIGKSLKIIGPSGVYGGISAITPGTDGITINAGDNDVVTLRGLDVTGLGGRNGVNVVNAKAVHIEKSTVSGFADAAGACLKLDSTKNIRVFVNDSFLRDCQNGATVNGPGAGRPRLVLDNVRIERGTGINTDIGVWGTGQVDISIRNSVLTSLGYPLRFENATPSIFPILTIVDSHFHSTTNPVIVANSGAGSQMSVEIERSHLKGVGLDVSANNNARTGVFADQVTLSSNGSAIKTSGTSGSWVQVGLTRSRVHTSNIAIDHGFGQAALNASEIVWNTNSIVNNGSGDVKSLNNNLFMHNADATVGFVYVTPQIVAPK
jgi:hypothetical protein